jgi:hypothetical protein
MANTPNQAANDQAIAEYGAEVGASVGGEAVSGEVALGVVGGVARGRELRMSTGGRIQESTSLPLLV